jgi:hypothetical protein
MVQKQDLFSEGISVKPQIGASILNCSLSKGFGASPTFTLNYLLKDESDLELEKITIEDIEFKITNISVSPSRSGRRVSISGIDTIQDILQMKSEIQVVYISNTYNIMQTQLNKMADDAPKPIVRHAKSRDIWGTGGWTLHDMLKDFWEVIGAADENIELEIHPKVPDVTISTWVFKPGASLQELLKGPVKQILQSQDVFVWGEHVKNEGNSPIGEQPIEEFKVPDEESEGESEEEVTKKVIIAPQYVELSNKINTQEGKTRISTSEQTSDLYKMSSRLLLIGGVGPDTDRSKKQPDCATSNAPPDDEDAWPDCGSHRSHYDNGYPHMPSGAEAKEIYDEVETTVPEKDDDIDTIKQEGGSVLYKKALSVPGLATTVPIEIVEKIYNPKQQEYQPLYTVKREFDYCFIPGAILKEVKTMYGYIPIGQGTAQDYREYTEGDPFARDTVEYTYAKAKDDKNKGTTMLVMTRRITTREVALGYSALMKNGEPVSQYDEDVTIINPHPVSTDPEQPSVQVTPLVEYEIETTEYTGSITKTSKVNKLTGKTTHDPVVRGNVPQPINKGKCYAYSKVNMYKIAPDSNPKFNWADDNISASPVNIDIMPSESDLKYVVAEMYEEAQKVAKRKTVQMKIGGVYFATYEAGPNIKVSTSIDYTSAKASTTIQWREYLTYSGEAI